MTNASIRDFPYHVSIEWQYRDWCQGAIIAKNWIITVDQCTTSQPNSSYKVRAGTDVRGKDGSLHQVDKIVLHKRSSSELVGKLHVNDVALMHVKEPFEFDETRQAIGLYDRDDPLPARSPANVTGFGLVKGNWNSRNLHWVQLALMDPAECNEAYESYGGVPKRTSCVGYCGAGDKSVCHRDEGSPLVIGSRLAGLVSWSYSWSDSYYPHVYIEIARYRQWIDQHLQLLP